MTTAGVCVHCILQYDVMSPRTQCLSKARVTSIKWHRPWKQVSKLPVSDWSDDVLSFAHPVLVIAEFLMDHSLTELLRSRNIQWWWKVALKATDIHVQLHWGHFHHRNAVSYGCSFRSPPRGRRGDFSLLALHSWLLFEKVACSPGVQHNNITYWEALIVSSH